MRSLLAYSTTSTVEEKLTLRIKADNSGNIYLPTGGFSPEGTQNCPYDWMVSVDGGNALEYKGTGSSNGSIRVGYGLTPLSVHTIIVKPKVEEYLWLRAFAYKGASIASSLVNIISDKSYKGYALSEIYTGNYFKAYQYQGCTSLINTDEELLPDTLQIIGDCYRYYEYAGCTSLVSNADEKILKTVKVIGSHYRAYQYQNCTAMNTISMRAINWASVGANYRLNQYSGVGTDRNQVNIYIEGGIEEGGNWGLSNDNVKGIYVYKDLVSDYRTKLSGITSSKIQKNADWDGNEYEFIEFTAIADNSGKIRIPVGGYSISGTQNCAYDWMISIDGGTATEYTGTGSATYLSIGSGLAASSEHKIVIKPKTIGWGWGRAFGYYNTGAEAYIKELIHDSYKCYASSRTATGDYYKYATYNGCINLINSYEKLPTSVTSIGNHYMEKCYKGCTSLTTAFWEILPADATVGTDYRNSQYNGCTSMSTYEGMAGYTKTYPSNYRKDSFSNAGTNLDVYITRKEALPGENIASVSQLGYTASYTLATITNTGKYHFKCNVVENGGSGGTSCEVLKNNIQVGYEYSGGGTIVMDVQFDAASGDVITLKIERWSYGNGNCTNITLDRVYNVTGMGNSNIQGIYCYIDDLFGYQYSNNWGLDIDKFKGWYYGYKCYELKSINRYTRLLASIQLPSIDRYIETNYSTFSGWEGGQYNRGVGIDRSINWSSISFGITEYGKDSTGNNHVGVITLSLSTTTTNGNRVITNAGIQGGQSWGGSNTGGLSAVSFANGINIGTNGFIYGAYAYDGYYGLRGLGAVPGITGGNQYAATAISRNGKYMRGNRRGYGVFHTDNANNFTSFIKKDVDTIYGNLIFSDDGKTMITGNSDWTQLTEYSLSTPRTVSTATATGNSLTVKGQVSMSSDGRYLFVFDDTTNILYQYTYE